MDGNERYDPVLPPLSQLLGRPEQPFDTDSFAALIRGRRVLVTGAGGSIGSQLCAAILPLRPAALLMLDRDESALEAMLLSLRSAQAGGPETEVKLLLADVRHAARIDRLMGAARPSVVLHTAALKHVPLLQAHPVEALHTNVLGTLNVLRAAARIGTEAFLNLSSDKAADPSNVLGHSKYLSERLVAWFGQQTGAATEAAGRYVSVRLGNVLATRGSMLDVFHRQLTLGHPLTLTDRRATRFLTVPQEAVRMIFSACVEGRSGETLVQDLGEPVLIADLIRRIAEFNGYTEIVEVGLRPGEKLHETLLGEREQVIRRIPRGGVRAVRVPPIDPADVEGAVAESDGDVTAEWLATLAGPGELAGSETGMTAAGLRDRFGFPIGWAIDFRRSALDFERAAARGDFESDLRQATTRLVDGHYADAVAMLAGRAMSFRDTFNLGVALEELGAPGEAAVHLTRAERLDPRRFAELRNVPSLRSAAVVLPFPVTSGGMRVLAQYAETLARADLDVDVFQMRDPGSGPRLELEGVREVVSVRSQRDLVRLLGATKRRLTIVGSWMDYLTALRSRTGPIVGFSGGEPTLNENDGFDEAFLEFRKRAHWLPVRLLTCSRFVQDIYRTTFKRRSEYLPVALDDDAFLPARPTPSGALRHARFRVLVMAWDGIKDKGLDYAIPALCNLQQRGMPLEIVWVTPQPPVVYRDIDCELHVNPPRDELFRVLRSCHAMVYTPLVDGLGLPPMEAMAAGVAVIATDSGGSREFLEAGVTGIEVATASVPEIEQAVERLYFDPVFRNGLISRARQFADRYRRNAVETVAQEYISRTAPVFCIDID